MSTLSLVTSSSFSAFNWLQTDCSGGPPSSIVTYANDSLSNSLSLVQQDYVFSSCRYKTAVAGENCCHSLIRKGEHGIPYQGFAGTYNIGSLPASANGKTYCYVEYSSSNSSSPSPIISAYFLQDGGCSEGITCSKGILSIYSSKTCIGDSLEDFRLDQNFKSAASIKMGTFQASLKQISTGSLNYKWTTFYPQSAYYPLNTSSIEIFGTFCQGAALFISLCSFFLYAKAAIQLSNNKVKIYALFALSHLLWFVYEIVDVYFQYLVTDNINVYNIVVQLDGTLMNFATLTTVFVNAHNVMHLVFKPSWVSRMAVYAALFALHFLLAGSLYFSYYMQGTSTFSQNLTYWANTFGVYWNVFMFIFDSLTCLICAVFIVRVTKLSSRKSTIYKSLVRAFQERAIILAFVLQMIIMLVYYFIYVIVHYTVLTVNDRVDSTLQFGVQNLLYALHAAISCRSFDYFSTLLVKMQQEDKQEKQAVRDLEFAKDYKAADGIVYNNRASASFPAIMKQPSPILDTNTFLNASQFTSPIHSTLGRSDPTVERHQFSASTGSSSPSSSKSGLGSEGSTKKGGSPVDQDSLIYMPMPSRSVAFRESASFPAAPMNMISPFSRESTSFVGANNTAGARRRSVTRSSFGFV